MFVVEYGDIGEAALEKPDWNLNKDLGNNVQA